MVTFNTQGLDFVLTALFVVIFLGQWKSQQDHNPAIIGIVCSVICVVVFGPNNFIIPAMVAIMVTLTMMRKKYVADDALTERKAP